MLQYRLKKKLFKHVKIQDGVHPYSSYNFRNPNGDPINLGYPTYLYVQENASILLKKSIYSCISNILVQESIIQMISTTLDICYEGSKNEEL